MNNDLNFTPPSPLVAEYKSTSLIARGILSIVIIIILLITTDVLSNFIAMILLGIWFIIAVLWIKKAYLDTALIITNNGIKINDKHTVEWSHIDNFLIKTIVVDGEETERLIINTKTKDFKLDIEDLDVDKERLNRWINFFKQKRWTASR